jgi:hypothetical protein
MREFRDRPRSTAPASLRVRSEPGREQAIAPTPARPPIPEESDPSRRPYVRAQSPCGAETCLGKLTLLGSALPPGDHLSSRRRRREATLAVFCEPPGAGPKQRRRCKIWICRRVTQFAGPRVAKPRWSEACVAARSVSKKHAGVTSFQPKSSRLGRRRSKPTASGRCTSPGPSITGMLPSVQTAQ